MGGGNIVTTAFTDAMGNMVNNASNQSNAVQTPTYNQNLQNAQSNFQSQYGSNPFVQAAQANAQGNILGAQAATAANRVNQVTPFGSLQYTQSGVDQFGNPTYTATQTFSPEMQGALGGLQNRVTQAAQQNVDPNQFMARGLSDQNMGMQGWDRATGLVMQRLQPQLERQQRNLDTQLANQGIMRGSEAYNQAQQDLAMKQNDLLNQATLAGQQVQQNLFGQDLQAQNLANQAAQLNFGQAVTGSNLPFAQLGAFRQATAPTFVNPYTQAAVAGPDVLGAYTSSEAARIAQMNAEAAKQAALTGGLFQLGGSALSNPSGLGGLINTGINIGKDIIGGIGDVFGF